MLCPHCNTAMKEITKSGVLIDLCPDCKGTWLDRGELEKILNRAREVEQEWEEERARLVRRPRDYDDDDRYERRYDSDRHYRKKRWTDIFDIFD
jgi:Zn-finger nucleic acid-binding protein